MKIENHKIKWFYISLNYIKINSKYSSSSSSSCYRNKISDNKGVEKIVVMIEINRIVKVDCNGRNGNNIHEKK